MASQPASDIWRPIGNWTALVSLSGAFAALLWWLHAPAALMLGPLLASALVTANGGKLRLPARPFVLAQGIIGCMIARSVPASIAGDILAHWFLFTVGVFAVVAISSLLGWMMTHLQVLPGTTALWGTSPGAASVMTIMAEEYGADIRLVAFMQYLRVVVVAGFAALVARLFGVATGHASAETIWFPHIAWLPFGETMALAIGGPLIARALRIPAGAMLVPMVLGAVLVHFDWLTIELPPWLLAGCYALIGWNVGLRFTRSLLVHAVRALPGILGGVLAMILLCGAVAGLLVAFAGIDPLTAYLATSPGGADSVAIIAASTNVDLSFVMAMQTVRLFAVLFLAPVITKFIATRAYDA